jgi:hypothetical protein
MSNPWLKKNPFMSMWLSTANRLAGSIRGQATAQVKRQLRATATEVANENVKLWTSALTGPTAKKTRKR